MALLIPPQLLALLVGVFMWSIASSQLVSTMNLTFLEPLAMVLFVIAFTIGGMAFTALNKAKTTTNVHCPYEASSLVRVGIYKYSRHPMYLSLVLMLSAVFCFFADPINIMPLMFFIWYINKFQIIPEEQALEKRFPRKAKEYKNQVRRWI